MIALLFFHTHTALKVHHILRFKDMNSYFCFFILKVSLKNSKWEIGFHIFSLVSFWYLLMVFHWSGCRVHVHVQRQLLSWMHSQVNRWYWCQWELPQFSHWVHSTVLFPLQFGGSFVSTLFTILNCIWAMLRLHECITEPCFHGPLCI